MTTKQKRKRISKKEASQKYGIITSGVNSLYSYFLLENGDVVDSDGDIRYYAPKKYRVSMAVQRPLNAEIEIEARSPAEAFEKAQNAWDNGEWAKEGGWIDEDTYVGDDVLDLSDPDDSKDPWNPDKTSGVFVEEVKKKKKK